MRGAHVRAVIAAVFVVAVVGETATADPRAIAETNFRLGARAYKAQDFEAAAADFEIAYDAMPAAEIAFSAAQAHRRWYHVKHQPHDIARAMELYRVYLQTVQSGGRVRDAEDAVAELQHDYDKLAAEGKLGKEAQIAVTRLAVGVTFADHVERHTFSEVDDQTATPETPVHVDVDGNEVRPNAYGGVEPGTHVVHVSAAGYIPVERKVPVHAGASETIDVDLQPKPARVAITTDGGARITVDGREVGLAPLPAFDVAPGKHLLAVAANGRELAGRELDVVRGQELTLAVPLVRTTRRKLVPYVVGGASVATVLCLTSVGLAFYYQHAAQDDHQKLMAGDQSSGPYNDYNSDKDWRDRHVIGAWTTGGLAIGLGLTAAWLYYFDKPGSEGVRVTPTGVAGHF
jgi:hypothetical protein